MTRPMPAISPVLLPEESVASSGVPATSGSSATPPTAPQSMVIWSALSPTFVFAAITLLSVV